MSEKVIPERMHDPCEDYGADPAAAIAYQKYHRNHEEARFEQEQGIGRGSRCQNSVHPNEYNDPLWELYGGSSEIDRLEGQRFY